MDKPYNSSEQNDLVVPAPPFFAAAAQVVAHDLRVARACRVAVQNDNVCVCVCVLCACVCV
jgi:hypothetical protein